MPVATEGFTYQAGIELYSISVRSEFTRPAGPTRQEQIDGLKKWIDVAAKLGAGHIRVFGGKIQEGSNEGEAAKWVAEMLLLNLGLIFSY